MDINAMAMRIATELTDTIECPDCGQEMLKNSGYCLKCKDKTASSEKIHGTIRIDFNAEVDRTSSTKYDQDKIKDAIETAISRGGLGFIQVRDIFVNIA